LARILRIAELTQLCKAAFAACSCKAVAILPKDVIEIVESLTVIALGYDGHSRLTIHLIEQFQFVKARISATLPL
jgi:hypothetical protein